MPRALIVLDIDMWGSSRNKINMLLSMITKCSGNKIDMPLSMLTEKLTAQANTTVRGQRRWGGGASSHPCHVCKSANQELSACFAEVKCTFGYFCCEKEDHLHMLKNQHGLALPWACAVELHNTPVKTQRLKNLNLLQCHTMVRSYAI